MKKNSEGLFEVESFEQTRSWIRRWLSPKELDEAREKLITVLRDDFKMTERWTDACADHIIGIKAMTNAGYSADYIQKLMIRKNLVQEFYETKGKLRHMNKQYGRASKTISELKGKLALRWRDSASTELIYTLNTIEKIQEQLKEIQNGSNTTS